MQEDLKSDIIIRDMQESDVSLIILSAKEQRKDFDVEKFYNRLEEQSKGKNFALVAEYDGEIAGYVYVYPFSKTGLLKGGNYSEIVDLTVFTKYQNLNVANKLMDAAEDIASNYSAIVYLSVDVHDFEALNLYVKREFIVHKSGIWRENNSCNNCSEGKISDKLVFGLFKNLGEANFHRFVMSDTLRRPCLKWFQEGRQTVFGSINFEKCHKIKVGEEILLSNRQNSAYVKGIVYFKHEYATIREMLQSEGVKNLFPALNEDELGKAVKEYQNIPEFHCVDEYGCVAFGLQIVESKL